MLEPAGLHYQKDSGTGVSCKYCENVKNTYFEEHLRTRFSDSRFSDFIILESQLDETSRLQMIVVYIQMYSYCRYLYLISAMDFILMETTEMHLRYTME